MTEVIWKQPQVIQWSQCLLNSYEKYLGKELIVRNGDPVAEAEFLFYAPFVLVSHNSDTDPILNYGNQVALELWEMDWEEFTQTPSRYTAEPVNQEERQRMLSLATQQGFIDNFQGVRISRTGKRFVLEKAIIWNIVDTEGQACGQAATFSDWKMLFS
ncbi:MEKHLA domain-containing protein [Gloeocapsa sp. PCC 73106]|uniref:MEKHLA domain-containing protein n=1 Tax=Gloeocapsa sp. PCC 73106 TaxID=102232 RepID=UPI0002ABB652|nr:MEKHLA domain-containing protein [Gloeocapsa sp. PCC 73106]ELR97590.1 MEKHLA domain-containing protein [Gloeocapsa sp. PCC 73106]